MTRTRIAVIGDVHHELASLDRALERVATLRPDLVVSVGDIGVDLPFRRPAEDEALKRHHDSVHDVLARLRGVGAPIAWVPGNHDLRRSPHADNVDGVVTMRAGLRVLGIGGAGPMKFGFPYEWSDEELAQQAIDTAGIDLVISHTPPWGTSLDRTASGANAGSRTVRGIAEQTRGIMLSGHIHEAAGAEQLGQCICVNAGAFGRPFGRSCFAWVELELLADRRVVRVEQHEIEDDRIARWHFEIAAHGS